MGSKKDKVVENHVNRYTSSSNSKQKQLIHHYLKKYTKCENIDTRITIECIINHFLDNNMIPINYFSNSSNDTSSFLHLVRILFVEGECGRGNECYKLEKLRDYIKKNNPNHVSKKALDFIIMARSIDEDERKNIVDFIKENEKLVLPILDKLKKITEFRCDVSSSDYDEQIEFFSIEKYIKEYSKNKIQIKGWFGTTFIGMFINIYYVARRAEYFEIEDYIPLFNFYSELNPTKPMVHKWIKLLLSQEMLSDYLYEQRNFEQLSKQMPRLRLIYSFVYIDKLDSFPDGFNKKFRIGGEEIKEFYQLRGKPTSSNFDSSDIRDDMFKYIQENAFHLERDAKIEFFKVFLHAVFLTENPIPSYPEFEEIFQNEIVEACLYLYPVYFEEGVYFEDVSEKIHTIFEKYKKSVSFLLRNKVSRMLEKVNEIEQFGY
jgi:hypothetical protein